LYHIFFSYHRFFYVLVQSCHSLALVLQFNNPTAAPQGRGKGIVTAILQTNSTGILAPLNGMILAGIDDFASDGDSRVTLWRWESGIPLPTGNATATEQSPSSSLMNTTTTNATAATPM
jgi:hypothetical protein